MQLALLPDPPKPRRKSPMLYRPSEYKLVTMRECVCPPELLLCDTPERAADYWRLHVEGHPYFNPDVECMVALLLNTRRRVMGHHLVATGILDTILCHPREVFRAAIVAAAGALILMHNLCAATHKLCYVERRFMCSRSSDALGPTRVLFRKEGCATE